MTGPDPNTNSFVRVWCAPSRTEEPRRKEKGRAYLVDSRRRQRAGRRRDEWRRRSTSRSPPVKESQGMRLRESEKGKGERNRDEPEALSPEGEGAREG